MSVAPLRTVVPIFKHIFADVTAYGEFFGLKLENGCESRRLRENVVVSRKCHYLYNYVNGFEVIDKTTSYDECGASERGCQCRGRGREFLYEYIDVLARRGFAAARRRVSTRFDRYQPVVYTYIHMLRLRTYVYLRRYEEAVASNGWVLRAQARRAIASAGSRILAARWSKSRTPRRAAAGRLVLGEKTASVAKARLRFASDQHLHHKTVTFDDKMEITSLVGTICKDGAHLHTTLGNQHGQTVSGQVVGDFVVHTTAEIVLANANDSIFSREYDQNTGFSELVIETVGSNKQAE
ncbi:hypothetical protein U1Q18_049514 [Sarracenia purpurea var. burkii]